MFNLRRTLALTKGALLDRDATWRAYLPDAGNWLQTACLLAIPLIIISSVVSYLLGLLMHDASLLGLFRPTLTTALLRMLSGFLGLCVVAFVFSTMAGVFGGRNRFAFGFAAATLAFVPGYVGQALASLPWIGWLLGIALAIYSLVLLWKIIPLYLEVPDGKRAVHYIVSLIIVIVVMAVMSRLLAPMLGTAAMRDAAIATSVGSMSPSSSVGSLKDQMLRHVKLVDQTSKAVYEPPADGKLTDTQVREFAAIVQQVSEKQADITEHFKAMADKQKETGTSQIQDLGSIMDSAGQLQRFAAIEMETVVDMDGNWAEYQWVRKALLTARQQKNTNEISAHNFSLYQKYAGQLQGLH